MLPGLPPPFGNPNQNQGITNVPHPTSSQPGVHNFCNMWNGFSQRPPFYSFPLPNHSLVTLNGQSVAPQPHFANNQLAFQAVASDGRNINMPSLCGNPLGLQSATLQLNQQNQCLNQTPAIFPQMMQVHSSTSNQLVQPQFFQNPGLVVANNQMSSGNPVSSSNVSTVPNNGPLHESLAIEYNRIAQILSQNMPYFGAIAAQQVRMGDLPQHNQMPSLPQHNQMPSLPQHNQMPSLPQHNQVPSGMQQIPPTFLPANIQQNLPLPIMNQNGSQCQDATPPNFNMATQHNKAPQKDQQEQHPQGPQKVKMKTGGGVSTNSFPLVHHLNATKINSGRGQHRSWAKEPKNSRFHRGAFNHLGNRKQGFTSDNGPRDNQTSNCKDQERQIRKRSTQLTYTEEEIRQWREERRKNYPTNLNIEKKVKRTAPEMQRVSKLVDPCTEKRRQQLKEILAKQAELGMEVAELPPGYLSDSEKTCRKHHNNKFDRGSLKNKRNRNHKFQGDDHKHAKSQKVGDGGLSKSVLSTREPSLLQKLLNADVEKDKSRLLQVFRFMKLNSFFELKQPLQFPLVTAKDSAGSYQQLVEDEDTYKGLDVENSSNSNYDEDGAVLGVFKKKHTLSPTADDHPPESEAEEGEIVN